MDFRKLHMNCKESSRPLTGDHDLDLDLQDKFTVKLTSLNVCRDK